MRLTLPGILQFGAVRKPALAGPIPWDMRRGGWPDNRKKWPIEMTKVEGGNSRIIPLTSLFEYAIREVGADSAMYLWDCTYEWVSRSFLGRLAFSGSKDGNHVTRIC